MAGRKACHLYFYCTVLLLFTLVPAFHSRVLDNSAGNREHVKPNNNIGHGGSMQQRVKRARTSNFTASQKECTISVEAATVVLVRSLVGKGLKLVEYDINFPRYPKNPLLVDVAEGFQSHMWKRPLSRHGEILLTLPFNYKLLSLTMLSFGVETVDVDLFDSPQGCFANLTNEEKVGKIARFINSDFEGSHNPKEESGRACHQRVQNNNGIAMFLYECCENLSGSDEIICTPVRPGKWISFMTTFIKLLKVVVFLFGPSLWIYFIYDHSSYVVALKKPVLKSILALKDTWASFKVFSQEGAPLAIYPQFAKDSTQIAPGKLKCVSFKELHIRVDHRRLIDPKSVPVGVFRFLFNNLIWCGMRDWEPFNTCCKKNVLGTWGPRFLWIKLCRKTEYWPGRCSWERIFNIMGGLSLLVAIPFPYYIRLVIYYMFEKPVIEERMESAQNLGLKYPLEESLVNYMGPTHPFMILVYVCYFLCFLLCIIVRACYGKAFDVISMGAVRDMANIRRLESFRLLIAHAVLPLEKFGLCGFLFAVIYWPLAMPLCALVVAFYFCPMVYLVGRYFVPYRPRWMRTQPVFTPAKINQTLSHDATSFESCLLLNNISPWHRDSGEWKYPIPLYVGIGILCSLLNMSFFLIYAEVFGFIVEVFIFTLMGAVVNSSNAATYFTLGFWIIVYANSCFTNVYNAYMDLNQKIFEGLIEPLANEITEVTNLREDVQQNTAFKFYEAEELDELRKKDRDQAKRRSSITTRDHQNFISDRLECIGDRLYWRINSLAMFVDNQDTPYIPETLFHEICSLDCAGCPGPVHLSLFSALKQLLIMVVFLVFVLITVMTFGDELSSGNQMLIALAGGFLPFVIRFVLKPKAPEVDINSLAFKAKLYHIKLRYNELWPVEDLHFTIKDAEDETSEDIDLPVQGPMTQAEAEDTDRRRSMRNWFRRTISTVMSGLEDQLEYGRDFYNPAPVSRPYSYSARASQMPSFTALESQTNLITIDPTKGRVQVSYQNQDDCEEIVIRDDDEGCNDEVKVKEADELRGSLIRRNVSETSL